MVKKDRAIHVQKFNDPGSNVLTESLHQLHSPSREYCQRPKTDVSVLLFKRGKTNYANGIISLMIYSHEYDID